ncbi:methyltransferase, partial [Lacticaseibacillus rhamnosus]|uniref:methyltransferase n=1 Tax=Lacticaseibacillus rhamnosus TaxID=47715 RepID=UPI003F476FAE
ARLHRPEPGERLCDLGSGPGIVGLTCALHRPDLSVTLVERDPALAALARANASLNGVVAEVIEVDVLAPGREREAAGLRPDAFDSVLTNPPFFEEG